MRHQQAAVESESMATVFERALAGKGVVFSDVPEGVIVMIS